MQRAETVRAMELSKLTISQELDSSKVESSVTKLQREASLLFGGACSGTADSAVEGFTDPEKWGRTALNIGLAAALTIAMKRPGAWGNIARGAGTLGALNFGYDIIKDTDRLGAVYGAATDTWKSPDNYANNYEVVKRQLGPLGFDTLLGVGGGALGAGLAWKFSVGRPGEGVTKFSSELKSTELTRVSSEVTPAAAAAESNLTRTLVEKTPVEGQPVKPLETSTVTDRVTLAPEAAELKAINLFSKSEEPLGKALSNFAHTPFELDGVQYASIEAFYQSLKFVDPIKRAEIAPLWGSYAKSASSKAISIAETSYMGQTFKLGSAEHHALIERAIRAKIEQNPWIKEALIESYPRPLEHNTRTRPDAAPRPPRKSNFPDDVFVGMVDRIRTDLVKAGPHQPEPFFRGLLHEIDAKGGKSTTLEPMAIDTVNGGILKREVPLQTVSELLRGIKDESLIDFHDLQGWAKTFEGFDRKATTVLGGGKDSVSLRLEDGNVLKIHSRPFDTTFGTRPFDAPVLEHGQLPAGNINIKYFVQPYTTKPLQVDMLTMVKSIDSAGFSFNEPFLSQLGRLEGRVVLLDPWAVKPKQ